MNNNDNYSKFFDEMENMLNNCEIAWSNWQDAAWVSDKSGRDNWMPDTKIAKRLLAKMFEVRARTIEYAVENNLTERLPYYMQPMPV
jgi:hypothetical protein